MRTHARKYLWFQGCLYHLSIHLLIHLSIHTCTCVQYTRMCVCMRAWSEHAYMRHLNNAVKKDKLRLKVVRHMMGCRHILSFVWFLSCNCTILQGMARGVALHIVFVSAWQGERDGREREREQEREGGRERESERERERESKRETARERDRERKREKTAERERERERKTAERARRE